jgi:hypothetical protein
MWEESHEPIIRKKLITYNEDDCAALSLIARVIDQLKAQELETPSTLKAPFVRADSLIGNFPKRWSAFKSPISDLEKINLAARWNYQRDRVFVRSGVRKRRKTLQSTSAQRIKKTEKVVIIRSSMVCPQCDKRSPRKERLLSKTVQDLVFGRDSVKRRVVRYVAQTYRCRSCGNVYGQNVLSLHGRNWGWNIVSYFIYHIVGLCIPQLTVQHSMNRVFGARFVRSTLNELKIKASLTYLDAKRAILDRIIGGKLIHADETSANI